MQVPKNILDTLPIWKGSAPKKAKPGDLLVRRDGDGWPTGIVKLRQQGRHLNGENYTLVCPELGERPTPEPKPVGKKKAAGKKKAKK